MGHISGVRMNTVRILTVMVSCLMKDSTLEHLPLPLPLRRQRWPDRNCSWLGHEPKREQAALSIGSVAAHVWPALTQLALLEARHKQQRRALCTGSCVLWASK